MCCFAVHRVNGMKGSIYMVFDYMEHDLTGLMEREGHRFTVPQVIQSRRPPVSQLFSHSVASNSSLSLAQWRQHSRTLHDRWQLVDHIHYSKEFFQSVCVCHSLAGTYCPFGQSTLIIIALGRSQAVLHGYTISLSIQTVTDLLPLNKLRLTAPRLCADQAVHEAAVQWPCTLPYQWCRPPRSQGI